MMMTTAPLLSLLLFAPQVPQPKDPSPAEAAAKIVAAIKKAVGPSVSTIEEFGRIADPLVTKAIGRALRHSDVRVRAAAVSALRFNPHESAIKELLRVRRDKKVTADPVVGPDYYLALGQHGDLAALPTLTAGLAVRDRGGDRVTNARLLALGRMRSVDAIEALVRYLKSGRGARRGGATTALVVLTQQDFGKSSLDWSRWWSKNRGGFQVKPPKLSGRHAKVWGRVWADPAAPVVKNKKRRKQSETGAEGGGLAQEDPGSDVATRRR